MPDTKPPPTFAPPYCDAEAATEQLRSRGFALLSGDDTRRWSGASAEALNALAASWNDLPADAYLLDGGRYRFRRHSCFELGPRAKVSVVSHRAHWQPLQYNALHGGIQRWFEPMLAATVQNSALEQLLSAMDALCRKLFPVSPNEAPGFVEAHQFRIDTATGIGRPTPEGAHRDGVDLVAVFLVARKGVKGGETRIFEAASPAGQRFTLTQPWSVLLLDDARMVHETTPIQPAQTVPQQPEGTATGAYEGAGAASGHRDTLVLTWRRNGFQGPTQAENPTDD